MSDNLQKVSGTFNERMRLNRLRRKKENLRFWNEEVTSSPEGAVEKIRNHIFDKGPHPALRADLSLRERN